MRHSIDNLLAVVYQHYPKNLTGDDPGYQQVEEVRRLVAAREQAGADQGRWRAFLRQVEHQFPEATMHNGSLHLPTGNYDAAYSGKLFLATAAGEHSHTIGFLISFLVPYYVLYSSRVVDDLEKKKEPSPQVVAFFEGDTCHIVPANNSLAAVAEVSKLEPRREILSFDFSPNEQPYTAWLAREIEATWGFERMPSEIGKIIVPDVTTNIRYFGSATLYDCLFSDQW